MPARGNVAALPEVFSPPLPEAKLNYATHLAAAEAAFQPKVSRAPVEPRLTVVPLRPPPQQVDAPFAPVRAPPKIRHGKLAGDATMKQLHDAYEQRRPAEEALRQQLEVTCRRDPNPSLLSLL